MATVYLAPSPTGDDSRTYAQAQNSATPWATFGKVQASGVSGDSVVVAAGTYPTPGTLSKILTWIGPSLSGGLPTAIIDGAGASSLITIQSQTFSNIMFQNYSKTTAQSVFNTGNNLTTNIFNNCAFRNMDLQCGISGDGFGLFSIDQNQATFTFTNCLFYDLRTASGSLAKSWLVDGRNGTINFTGCVFAHTAGAGATGLAGVFRRNTTSGTYTITIKNSIFYSSTSISYATGSGYTSSATYSDFFQISGNPAGTGVITSDPLLIDPVNANFRTRPGSPCWWTGISV